MIGYFSREVVSDFWSLRGDIVFEALWARQSPAAKIPFLAVHRPFSRMTRAGERVSREWTCCARCLKQSGREGV